MSQHLNEEPTTIQPTSQNDATEKNDYVPVYFVYNVQNTEYSMDFFNGIMQFVSANLSTKRSDNVSFHTLFTTTNCCQCWPLKDFIKFSFLSFILTLDPLPFFICHSLRLERCQTVKATNQFSLRFSLFIANNNLCYEKSGSLDHMYSIG